MIKIEKQLEDNIITIKARLKMLDKDEETSDFNEGYKIGQREIYEMWLFSIQQNLKETK